MRLGGAVIVVPTHRLVFPLNLTFSLREKERMELSSRYVFDGGSAEFQDVFGWGTVFTCGGLEGGGVLQVGEGGPQPGGSGIGLFGELAGWGSGIAD